MKSFALISFLFWVPGVVFLYGEALGEEWGLSLIHI